MDPSSLLGKLRHLRRWSRNLIRFPRIQVGKLYVVSSSLFKPNLVLVDLFDSQLLISELNGQGIGTIRIKKCCNFGCAFLQGHLISRMALWRKQRRI